MVVPALQQNKDFQLAQEVFIEFARFEYCLKVSGFLKRPNGQAEPDWDAFSNCCEIKNLFNEISEEPAKTCSKMRYLLTHPPQKQVAENGKLAWEDAPDITDSQTYFGAVRRVRNNLFHGGKFNEIFFEPDRSAKLLEAVLCVLKAARARHEKITEAYG